MDADRWRFAAGLAILVLLNVSSASALAATLGVSQHIGFHQFSVGMTNQMQTWWNDSPYFDVGFYANGAANHPHNDMNLTASWVTTVQGDGWGLMPIWVGEQAPCFNSTSSIKFDWDPTVAANEGALEAGEAIASVGNQQSGGIGLQGTIIYFDMESYTSGQTNPNNPSQTCGAAVSAFLTGWVNGLHGAGFQAGAYGTGPDVTTDYVNVSPPPDDIWLSYVPNTTHDTVTVWNVHGSNYTLPDSPNWGNSQRVSQYTVDNPKKPCCTETWGGVPFKIDKDIEDGQVIAGATYKADSFVQQTTFMAPGNPTETAPQGISGISDAQYSGGQPPSGTLGGLIVGWWYNPYCPGCGDYGFAYDPNGGVFIADALDFDGTETTGLQGVNNGHLAVGYNSSWAFTYNTISGAVSQLPSWCTNCVALGINDANWIVGAVDADTNSVGFVYKRDQQQKTFLSLGVWNEISGINGQGIVTGYYSPDGNSVYGFIGDASQSGPISVLQNSIVCPNGYTVMFPGGINDNGQVAGYSEGGGAATGFWFDPGSCRDLSPTFSSGQGVTYGLNDYAQIVGAPLNSAQGVVLFPAAH